MKYLDLINRFWRLDRTAEFTGEETRLYFYLLDLANSQAWPESFERADKKTAADNRQSLNSMKKYRDRLREIGLIGFESGGDGRGSRGRYEIRYHNLTPIELERYQNLTPKEGEESRQNLTPKNDKVSRNESNFDTYSVYNRDKTFLSLPQDEESCQNLTPKEEVVESTLDANQTPPPSSATPPPSIDDDSPEEVRLRKLLQESETLVLGIRRYIKQIQGVVLTPDEVKIWMGRYAARECSTDNQKDRRNQDLYNHCRDWINQEVKKEQNELARKSNQAANHSPRPSGNGFASGAAKRTAIIPTGSFSSRRQALGNEVGQSDGRTVRVDVEQN